MKMQPIGTRQVSDILGVTPQRVRAMILAGRLKATKVGRDWLIDPPDLEAVKYRKPGRPRSDGIR